MVGGQGLLLNVVVGDVHGYRYTHGMLRGVSKHVWFVTLELGLRLYVASAEAQHTGSGTAGINDGGRDDDCAASNKHVKGILGRYQRI